ncbi:MAG: ABC transporter substrate-binding protein [Candidatus Bathyarchaeia archaeon]
MSMKGGFSRRSYLIYAVGLAVGAVVAYYGYSQYQKARYRKRVLRIGYQPSTHQLAHMTAMAKGWWMRELSSYGIEEVLEYEFPSGPPEMQAMLAGDLDVAYVGATPPIVAIDKGLDAKIVANAQIQGSHLALRSEIPFEGPSSLLGLKIATFPPGSIQNTVLRKWLLEHSINPDQDLTLVSMGPGDAVTAIAAGAVDGCFLPHPYPATIELEGSGRMVVGSGEMWPNHTCCCLVLSGELLRDRRDLAEEIVRTHIKATEYNIQHEGEAAEIFSEKTGWDLKAVQHSFKTWDGRWVHDPHIGMEITLKYAEVLKELGEVEHSLVARDLFDTTIYDEVASRL